MAHLRIIAVLIQAFVASGASVPWAHDHAELTQEQLCCHLRLCHSDSPCEQLPRGRHVHLSVLEAIVDGTTDVRSITEFAPAEYSSLDPVPVVAPFESAIALASTGSLQHGPPDRIRASFASASGCELFRAFGALRI